MKKKNCVKCFYGAYNTEGDWGKHTKVKRTYYCAYGRESVGETFQSLNRIVFPNSRVCSSFIFPNDWVPKRTRGVRTVRRL